MTTEQFEEIKKLLAKIVENTSSTASNTDRPTMAHDLDDVYYKLEIIEKSLKNAR